MIIKLIEPTIGCFLRMCTHDGGLEGSPSVFQVFGRLAHKKSEGAHSSHLRNPVCHTPQKCVFVRVVDTCAGCAPGTKHIDLTKAPFTELGKLDDGRLPVKFREATEPDIWSVFHQPVSSVVIYEARFEKLWGPKLHHVGPGKGK